MGRGGPTRPLWRTKLPGLIEVFHGPLGEIVDISINWSATEGPLELYESLPLLSRCAVGSAAVNV